MESFTFYLSELELTLRSDMPEVLRAERAVFQHCDRPLVPTRGRHTLEASLRGGEVCLTVDGLPSGGGRGRGDALPVLDRAYYERLPQWLGPGRVTIHASLILGRDASFLFMGHSGAGKSSLSLEGLRRGYHYAGDELCLSDGESLWGFPRAVMFDATPIGVRLPARLSHLDCAAYVCTDAAANEVCVPLFHPPREQIIRAPIPLDRVHVVVVDSAHAVGLAPAPPVLALSALHAGSRGEVQLDMGALIAPERCWQLGWTDIERAWDALEGLTPPPPPLASPYEGGEGR